MRIAVIGTYPPQRDGIGIYCSRIVGVLQKQQHQVQVFSFKGNEQKNVNAILQKNNPFTYLNLAKKLNKYNPDKVLIQYEYLHYNILFFPLLLFLLKAYGNKVNLMMHTIAPYTGGWKKIVFNLLHLSIFAFTDTLFLHTNNARKKLRNISWITPKINIIPISIQPQSIKQKKKSKNARLLIFGFITSDKGTDIAISAVKEMQNVSLKIVGSVNPYSNKKQKQYLEHIKKAAESAKNIQIVSRYVSEKEKAKIFREADFVLLPYRFIEQSAILTEVWGFGKIPIASNLPAFQEEIGESYGVLFRSNDPNSLRQQISSTIDNLALQSRLHKNIEALVKRRSFDINSQKILRLMM